MMDDEKFRYEVIVSPDSSHIPMEVVERPEYYYIALEIPGLSSGKDITYGFHLTQLGFLMTLKAHKKTAITGDTVATGESTRYLGDLQWKGRINGVFEGKPECNYKNGIFKIRLKKRLLMEEPVEFIDF